MEDKDIILLIHKDLSRQASFEEKSELEKSLNDHNSNRELYAQIKVLWDNSLEISKDPVNFSKTELKADIFNNIVGAPVQDKKKIISKFNRVVLYKVMATAAAIAILVSVSAVLFDSLSNNTIKAINELVYTELPDNSKIWISKNSSVKYLKSFNSDKRKVILKGSAYFAVAHHENQPFYVKILDNTIKVTGTSFEVKNYDDKNIEVNVYSGVVEFYEENGNFVTLKHGNGAIYNYDEKQFVLTKNGNRDSSLRSEYLTFQNADLGMVFERLSNYFDCQIEVNCDLISEMKGYTSPSFAGDNIEYYLNTIKVLYNINIKELTKKRFEINCSD